MNISYTNYNWGDKYSPVVVPLLRQIPMLPFFPPAVLVSAGHYRPQTIAEFQAYVQNLLANETHTIDEVWVAQTLDNTATSVVQAALVYQFQRSFAMWTGYSFTYVWPPSKNRPAAEFPDALTSRQFAPAENLYVNTSDPRIKVLPAGDPDKPVFE